MKTKCMYFLIALLFTSALAIQAGENKSPKEDVAPREDPTPKGHNPLRKLGRGFANLIFGVVEVPNQISKAGDEHGGAGAVTYGVGKGFVRWIGRELVGAYEVVTFPIPAPSKYKPIMKPEFPIEEF